MTSLGRRAGEVLERFGDHPALHFEGRCHSTAELASRARRAAAGDALPLTSVMKTDRKVLRVLLT